MKVTGTVLKKRQRYKAKGDADCLHRDIKAQNAWLLVNIFDASGNYLYCAACIVSVLGVREKRLARLCFSKEFLGKVQLDLLLCGQNWSCGLNHHSCMTQIG